jgi:hypothetical protein
MEQAGAIALVLANTDVGLISTTIPASVEVLILLALLV